MFGTFSPLTERLSSANTGMAILLSWSKRIDSIHLYAQEGAAIPYSSSRQKFIMGQPWRVDKTSSLVRTLVHMWRDSGVDVYFFNISLTMFGKKKLTNVVGLLLPAILSKLTRRKVVVYMHDFIETDEPAKFGYHISKISKSLVSILEHFIIRNTLVIVPRPSQKEILERKYRRKIRSVIIPYIEGIQSSFGPYHDSGQTNPVSDVTKFLLFGKWGPQKDLYGGLSLLSDVIKAGYNISITLAGSVNPNFPDYSLEMIRAMNTVPKHCLAYVGDVAEENIAELFMKSDVLFLPYKSSGGYSGVMNLGALYGLQIIAYEVEELREAAASIGVDALFINPDDPISVTQIASIVEQARIRQSRSTMSVPQKLELARERVENIINILEPSNQAPTILSAKIATDDKQLKRENNV